MWNGSIHALVAQGNFLQNTAGEKKKAAGRTGRSGKK